MATKGAAPMLDDGPDQVANLYPAMGKGPLAILMEADQSHFTGDVLGEPDRSLV